MFGTRNLILLFAAVFIAFSVPPREAHGQTTCPQDNPASRGLVVRFFGRSANKALRDSLGFAASVTDANIRTLTDASDVAVCQQLVSRAGASGSNPAWLWTAYQVGDYYLMGFRHKDTSGYWLGFRPLYIVDRSFNLVRVVSM